jgi:hypothetical protein
MSNDSTEQCRTVNATTGGDALRVYATMVTDTLQSLRVSFPELRNMASELECVMESMQRFDSVSVIEQHRYNDKVAVQYNQIQQCLTDTLRTQLCARRRRVPGADLDGDPKDVTFMDQQIHDTRVHIHDLVVAEACELRLGDVAELRCERDIILTYFQASTEMLADMRKDMRTLHTLTLDVAGTVEPVIQALKHACQTLSTNTTASGPDTHPVIQDLLCGITRALSEVHVSRCDDGVTEKADETEKTEEEGEEGEDDDTNDAPMAIMQSITRNGAKMRSGLLAICTPTIGAPVFHSVYLLREAAVAHAWDPWWVGLMHTRYMDHIQQHPDANGSLCVLRRALGAQWPWPWPEDRVGVSSFVGEWHRQLRTGSTTTTTVNVQITGQTTGTFPPHPSWDACCLVAHWLCIDRRDGGGGVYVGAPSRTLVHAMVLASNLGFDTADDHTILTMQRALLAFVAFLRDHPVLVDLVNAYGMYPLYVTPLFATFAFREAHGDRAVRIRPSCDGDRTPVARVEAVQGDMYLTALACQDGFRNTDGADEPKPTNPTTTATAADGDILVGWTTDQLNVLGMWCAYCTEYELRAAWLYLATPGHDWYAQSRTPTSTTTDNNGYVAVLRCAHLRVRGALRRDIQRASKGCCHPGAVLTQCLREYDALVATTMPLVHSDADC